jgi:PAS domain S-box-containing protein
MEIPLKILHLEDDDLAAELVQARLDGDGIACDILRVDTRADFVSALEGRRFDMILADYSLPSFDGLSALKIARETCPELPYIFISGQMGEDIAVEALKSGATDYVLKDRLSRLTPAIRRALKEAEDRAERRQAEANVRKLNRVYAVLSAVNHLIIRTSDQQALFEGACRILVEEGLFRMAWVGLVDEHTRTVLPAACSGCDDGYLNCIKISIDPVPEGEGPTGAAVRTAIHFINNDTENNPLMLPWRDDALRRGYLSSAAFPLMSEGKTFGAITVYAAERNFFDDEEIRLLDALAADISHAVRSMDQEGLRMRAEAESHELGEKLQSLVEDALVGVYIMQDNRLVYANERIAGILGYSMEEVLGIDVVELVHPDDKAMARENIRRRIDEENKEMHYEFRMLKKDGGIVFVEVLSSYTLYQGKPSIIGSLLDITERKQAEEKLVRAKTEWERTFDTVPDLISIIDKDHRILRVNEAMASRLGLKPDECIGLHCYEGVHGTCMPPEFCPHTRTISDGGQHIQEVHEPRLGGDFIVSTTPMLDEAGEFLGSVHVAHDITERKRAEEALRASEERYHSLFDNSNDAVFLISTEDRILDANTAASRMFGYGYVEMLRLDNAEIADKEDGRFLTLVSERTEKGYVVGECRFLRKDGTFFEGEMSSMIFKDEKGDGKISVIIRDITERKELERQRRDFIAMVTHDLKSPLTTILGYSELLLSKGVGLDEQEALDAIYNSGENLSSLVEDFLTISKMGKEGLALDLSLEDTVPLLRQVWKANRIAAAKKSLSFNLDITEDLPNVEFDSRLVQRALTNLLGNAINYTPAGGKVTLKADKQGDCIVIAVSDTGQGIPQEEQGMVFDKYYRSSKTSGVKGTGLGLAIVKAVAESHGGRVELESEEGKGSTFRMFLPIRQARQLPASQ